MPKSALLPAVAIACALARAPSAGAQTTPLAPSSPAASVPASPEFPSLLVTFEAADEWDGVLLDWVADFAGPTAYYLVERSAKGTTWTEAGRVSCNILPNGPLRYRFHDPVPFAGLNYYRVTRFADAGEPAVVAALTVVHEAAFGLTVWPNPVPAGDPVHLRYNGEEEHEFQVEIVDTRGQRLLRATRDSDAGVNQVSLNADVPRPGRYFLHVYIDDYPVQAYTLKVL